MLLHFFFYTFLRYSINVYKRLLLLLRLPVQRESFLRELKTRRHTHISNTTYIIYLRVYTNITCTQKYSGANYLAHFGWICDVSFYGCINATQLLRRIYCSDLFQFAICKGPLDLFTKYFAVCKWRSGPSDLNDLRAYTHICKQFSRKHAHSHGQHAWICIVYRYIDILSHRRHIDLVLLRLLLISVCICMHTCAWDHGRATWKICHCSLLSNR